MTSKRSDLKHLFKLRVSLEYFVQIHILQTENFGVWAIIIEGHVIVIINNLEYETNVPEIASFFKRNKWMPEIFVVHLHWASKYKIDSIAHDFLFQHTFWHTGIFKWERRCNHWDQFVVSFKTELWIIEKNFKLFLKLLQQVLSDYLNLHIFWDILVKHIFCQESVRTALKVFQCV